MIPRPPLTRYGDSWTFGALTPAQENEIARQLEKRAAVPRTPQEPAVMFVDVTEENLQAKLIELSKPPWVVINTAPCPQPRHDWRVFYRRVQVFPFVEGM